MSEEEKKAIFTLNEIDIDKLNDEENEAINIITRLITKQQEKITVLENIKNTCQFFATSGIECAEKRDKAFISKYKIREEIKGLKERMENKDNSKNTTKKIYVYIKLEV